MAARGDACDLAPAEEHRGRAAMPSVIVTSRAGAPARGTIRTERTSPPMRTFERGLMSVVGVTPNSSQYSRNFCRSSSSTGVVSRLTTFFSATPTR